MGGHSERHYTPVPGRSPSTTWAVGKADNLAAFVGTAASALSDPLPSLRGNDPDLDDTSCLPNVNLHNDTPSRTSIITINRKESSRGCKHTGQKGRSKRGEGRWGQ